MQEYQGEWLGMARGRHKRRPRSKAGVREESASRMLIIPALATSLGTSWLLSEKTTSTVYEGLPKLSALRSLPIASGT